MAARALPFLILLWATAANAQAVICPLTPTPAASNAICANTAFVHSVLGTLYAGAVTVAKLPAAAASKGLIANVTDGTSGLAWGATVTGGGATSYLVRSNGSHWTVVGE